MSQVTAEEVRQFVLEWLDEPLRMGGYDAGELRDDFDLLQAGVIDSLGLIEVIGAVEERFDVQIDFEYLDPSELTLIGTFSRFVASESAAPGHQSVR